MATDETPRTCGDCGHFIEDWEYCDVGWCRLTYDRVPDDGTCNRFEPFGEGTGEGKARR